MRRLSTLFLSRDILDIYPLLRLMQAELLSYDVRHPVRCTDDHQSLRMISYKSALDLISVVLIVEQSRSHGGRL